MWMKRLTERNKNSGIAFFPYCFRDDTCSGMGSSEQCDECKFMYDVCERLTKYEDTGLTPKQIRKMKKKMEGKGWVNT